MRLFLRESFINIKIKLDVIMILYGGRIVLNISKVKNDDQLSVALEGALDRNSAPLLDEELKASLDGVNKLIFDFKNLEYISSAGLRVILIAKKQLNGDNAVVIKGASREVREVFDVTGFSKILTISWL